MNDCNLTTCQYNKDNKCTNDEKRAECIEVSKKVLCEDNELIEDIVKVITDGECAMVYINGEKVPCDKIHLDFDGGKEPRCKISATWFKLNDNGTWMLNDDKTDFQREELRINW